MIASLLVSARGLCDIERVEFRVTQNHKSKIGKSWQDAIRPIISQMEKPKLRSPVGHRNHRIFPSVGALPLGYVT